MVLETKRPLTYAKNLNSLIYTCLNNATMHMHVRERCNFLRQLTTAAATTTATTNWGEKKKSFIYPKISRFKLHSSSFFFFLIRNKLEIEKGKSTRLSG